jgi:hypothetical protein
MQKVRIVCAVMGGAMWLSAAGSASATWSDVSYENGTCQANVNGGANTDGYFYTSVKPVAGDWLAGYDLRSQLTTMNVWSASQIRFAMWNMSTGNGGANSEVVFKIALSEPIQAAIWTAPHMDGLWTVNADYSVNGTDWTTAWTYTSGTDPSAVSLAFTGTTDTVYFRISTAGPTYWNTNYSGTFAFTAVPEPMTLGMLAFGAAVMIRRRIID